MNEGERSCPPGSIPAVELDGDSMRDLEGLPLAVGARGTPPGGVDIRVEPAGEGKILETCSFVEKSPGNATENPNAGKVVGRLEGTPTGGMKAIKQREGGDERVVARRYSTPPRGVPPVDDPAASVEERIVSLAERRKERVTVESAWSHDLHPAVNEFRYHIVSEVLRWRPENPERSDRDVYDDRESTEHLVVEGADGEVAGYARLLHGEVLEDFMMGDPTAFFRFLSEKSEAFFRELLKENPGKAVEATRFLMKVNKAEKEERAIMATMFREIVDRCVNNEKQFIIMVVSEKLYIQLAKAGFVFNHAEKGPEEEQIRIASIDLDASRDNIRSLCEENEKPLPPWYVWNKDE